MPYNNSLIKNIQLNLLYQLKNGCNWVDLPKDYPPYSTVYWHYKKWRDVGIFEKILQMLYQKCRIGLKKATIYPLNDDRFSGCKKYL